MKLTICHKCDGSNVEDVTKQVTITFPGKEYCHPFNGILCKDCGEFTVSNEDYHRIMAEVHRMIEESREEKGDGRNIIVYPGGKND
jgi:hypothetical protein